MELFEGLADGSHTSGLVDQAVRGVLQDQGGERGHRELAIGDNGQAVAVSTGTALRDDGGARRAHQCEPVLPFKVIEVSATTMVPSAFELRTANVPPIRSNRSRLPSSPRPRPSRVSLTSRGENPTPLSWTVTRIRPSGYWLRIRTAVALAWRTMLFTDSLTTRATSRKTVLATRASVRSSLQERVQWTARSMVSA